MAEKLSDNYYERNIMDNKSYHDRQEKKIDNVVGPDIHTIAL